MRGTVHTQPCPRSMEGDAGSRTAVAPVSVRQLSSKSVVYRPTRVREERALPSSPQSLPLSQLPHDMSMTMTMPSPGGGRGQGGGAGLLLPSHDAPTKRP